MHRTGPSSLLSGDQRPRLRLLADEPLPSLPEPSDLLDPGTPRRPGEMHEALPLSAHAATHVADAAAASGVAADVAATLLLEAGLIHSRLGAPVLAAASGAPRQPALGLSAAHARYVRSLTMERRAGAGTVRPPQSVAVPVRLTTRLAAAVVDELIDAVDLDHAVSWEVAAVLEGLTMTEWLLSAVHRQGDYSSACSPGAAESLLASRPSNKAS